MTKLLSFLALTCTLACTPAVYPEGARATARATVLGAVSGVRATTKMCAAIVTEGDASTDEASRTVSLSFGLRCRELLIPAIDGLNLAANAVDSWDAASPEKVGCGMKAVTVSLKAVADIVFLSGRQVPAWLVDSIQIASQVTPWANVLCDPKYPTNKVSAYVSSSH